MVPLLSLIVVDVVVVVVTTRGGWYGKVAPLPPPLLSHLMEVSPVVGEEEECEYENTDVRIGELYDHFGKDCAAAAAILADINEKKEKRKVRAKVTKLTISKGVRAEDGAEVRGKMATDSVEKRGSFRGNEATRKEEDVVVDVLVDRLDAERKEENVLDGEEEDTGFEGVDDIFFDLVEPQAEHMIRDVVTSLQGQIVTDHNFYTLLRAREYHDHDKSSLNNILIHGNKTHRDMNLHVDCTALYKPQRFPHDPSHDEQDEMQIEEQDDRDTLAEFALPGDEEESASIRERKKEMQRFFGLFNDNDGVTSTNNGKHEKRVGTSENSDRKTGEEMVPYDIYHSMWPMAPFQDLSLLPGRGACDVQVGALKSPSAEKSKWYPYAENCHFNEMEEKEEGELKETKTVHDAIDIPSFTVLLSVSSLVEILPETVIHRIFLFLVSSCMSIKSLPPFPPALPREHHAHVFSPFLTLLVRLSMF